MTDHFEDILDRSLDAVLRGESVDACGRRHPEAAAELKPLLELALSGREALRVSISDESRAAARERLMSQAAVLLNEHAANSGFWRLHGSRATKPLAIAGALLALTGGTAVAANTAGPDSFFYPMKQSLEDAREALAAQNLDKAAVEVGRAGKRLDEIQGMVDKGEPQYVPDLLAAYDNHMNQAAALVAEAAAQGKDTSQVVAMMDATRQRHDAVLAELAPQVPDDVRNAITQEESNQGGSGSNGNHEGGQAKPAESGDGNNSGGYGSGSTGDESHGNGNQGGSSDGNHSSEPDNYQKPAPEQEQIRPSGPEENKQDGGGPAGHGGSNSQENSMPSGHQH